MKVLILQAGFGAGGAEKIVAMIAAHRAAMGDEVHVAAMTCPAEGSYFDYPATVTQHVLEGGADGAGGAAGHSGVWYRLRATRRLIRRIRPDVVVSFLTKINVQTLLAAVGTGAAVIISERNNVRAQGAHPLWRHAQRVLMPRAAGIVMQTERACADVPARARSRTHVIPNPCAPRNPDGVFEPRSGPPRLSAVGRLSAQKGFDILLEALAPLRTKWPDLAVTIYGEGPDRAALETQRHALGLDEMVALPGNSGTPGDWLDRTDVLILSSRFEGFPNVVAEALVNGLPVVAFDCDFGPRELIEDGVNGLLVPDGDAAALGRQIARIIAAPDMRADMARHAPRMQARLAPDGILEHWDRVIGAAARQPAPRRHRAAPNPGMSES